MTHHCRQAMTPEEVLRGGPESTDGSGFETAIADVGGSITSVGEFKGGWGIGALVVAGGWDRWKCEGLI